MEHRCSQRRLVNGCFLVLTAFLWGLESEVKQMMFTKASTRTKPSYYIIGTISSVFWGKWQFNHKARSCTDLALTADSSSQPLGNKVVDDMQS